VVVLVGFLCGLFFGLWVVGFFSTVEPPPPPNKSPQKPHRNPPSLFFCLLGWGFCFGGVFGFFFVLWGLCWGVYFVGVFFWLFWGVFLV